MTLRATAAVSSRSEVWCICCAQKLRPIALDESVKGAVIQLIKSKIYCMDRLQPLLKREEEGEGRGGSRRLSG